MAHIFDRFLIHFFASAGICLCALFAIQFCQRKYKLTWLPSEFKPQLIVAAIAVFAGTALREAFDVAAGQTVAKAITDYLSWAFGCAVSIWALYRLKQG